MRVLLLAIATAVATLTFAPAAYASDPLCESATVLTPRVALVGWACTTVYDRPFMCKEPFYDTQMGVVVAGEVCYPLA